MDPDGGTQAVAAGLADRLAADVCPRCEEPRGTLAHASTSLFDDTPLVRCPRCGTRHTADVGAGAAQPVFTCTRCSVPFLADELLAQTEQICDDCRRGRLPADLVDAKVAAAIEDEMRRAIERSWTCVRAANLGQYLDRLAREIARRIEGAPADCRVALFDEEAVRTLALPSGLILLSVGALQSAADEAELVFLIGHEIAHAAAAEAAWRMVRWGLLGLSRRREPIDGQSWLCAVNDVVTLGYGRHREHDADARALDALLALGYDADAAFRLLRRFEARVEEGDARLSGYVVAHPPGVARRRHVEKHLFGRRIVGPRRVNREVFRRAVAPEVLAHDLARVSDLAAATDTSHHAERRGGRLLRIVFWLTALAVLSATLAMLLRLTL